MNAPSPFDAFKPLAGRALQSALNRLLALDPDTGAALKRLDGRRIQLALEAPPLALEIRVVGDALAVGKVEGDEPDLGIRATLSGVLSQLPFLRASDAAPVGKMRINGDAELARTLQKLAANFDPDWGQPFAEVFGPVLGPQIAKALREAFAAGGTFAKSFSRDAVDYLTEESRDLVGKAELAAFHDDVDALRDDVERLAVRLSRLAEPRP
ncbi:MAG TPA: SCP2 sterol-binding domain-containing protein [Arenimonas sp.]|nr:SCP2 sterol-binding domain-containing protein [Arenimonas sp.]